MVIRLVNMRAGSGQTLTYTSVNTQASVTEPSPGVFGHFAAEWFPAMMSAVLGNAEEAAEEGIHYLLLDVCLTCLNWHTLFPAVHKATPSLSPQVKVAADALMDYLVSCPMHGSLPNVLLLQVICCCCTSAMFRSCVGSTNWSLHRVKIFIYAWTCLPALSCELCKDEGCCLCC